MPKTVSKSYENAEDVWRSRFGVPCSRAVTSSSISTPAISGADPMQGWMRFTRWAVEAVEAMTKTAEANEAGDREAPPFLARMPTMDMDVWRALSALDEDLVTALSRGDIRLLRSQWLLAQPDGYKLPRRQDLEKLEMLGEVPMLPPEEAVALVKRGDRSVGVLSHAWLSPKDCDPAGSRMKVVHQAILEHENVEAFFWDQGSLSQHPRTSMETLAFKRALSGA